jgi:hypothetical protein
MQRHKMFLEEIHLARRAGKAARREAPEFQSMDFLTAYKNYEIFHQHLLGHWESLKIAQGESHNLDVFFESIKRKIDEITRKPLTLSP